MAGETKKFLDLAGLSTFLDNIKYNYAQGSDGYIPLKASQLETARTISLTGDVTGSVSFDGTQNVSITTTAGAGVANVVENVGWKQSGASTITWLTPATVGEGQDAKEKAVYIDLSGYALKSDIAAALNFKGSKTGTELAALTTASVDNGDVYTCTADGGSNPVFHAGYEYAATIDNNTLTWVELGKYLDLSGYVQTSTTVNNKALSSDIVLDGSDIALSSNYAVASTAAAPAAGDSVEAAIGKLQKEVADANAAATTYAFAEGSTDGAFQVTPTVGGVAGSAQSVAIHGLGSAAYADTTDFVDSSLTPAEAGAQVNVIEGITINGASTGVSVTNKIADLTIAADVADVQFKGNGDSNFASVVDANKVAKIDVSGYALTTDLANFIDLTDLSVTAGTGDYVTGIAYDNTTGVFTETKAAKGSIANNDTGLVDGDTVYDYVNDSNNHLVNTIESISVNGTAQTITSKAVDITVPVTDVQTKTTSAGSYTTTLDGTVAKIDLSGFIGLTSLSASDSGTGDYVTGVSYDNTSGAFTITKAAKGSVADNATGLVDGDTVYDYFEAHKADGNVIEAVKFKGNGDASASALTVDSSDKSVTVDVSGYALSTDLPTQATAIADADTGYATGDQVYDYIEAMAIPDASIEALFPSVAP